MSDQATAPDLAALRLSAQALAAPDMTTPVAVAERLLAMQAQDPLGVRLAIRARTCGLGVSDVDRALTAERSLVITWLNRGTLHLTPTEDLAWLHALTAPRTNNANARRLAQEGVSPSRAERGVRVIVRALTNHGPLSRDALREHLQRAGVPAQGQALIHLLLLASLRGHVVRGPVLPGTSFEQAFALARDWLGDGAPEAKSIDREQALGELARRYLAGHSPASERDLATWSGLPLGDARAGLRAIARNLISRSDGLLSLTTTSSPLPPPRLLGPFDPVLHGWRDRRWILDDHTEIVTVNGIFRAIALVRGRAAGTWTRRRGAVRLDLFAPIASEAATALEDDAADLARFLSA